ncbi:MAG TPA: LysR family transcriptional regulator [Kribbella sp.]|nr:LysR family transcriptional regulator [Kribbella sp.]
MLDLVRLRVLAAVAAHGSVTAAAEALHYTQPTVSHHLARLEAATGAKLVRKAGRGIRLTPEGELLARRAAEIVGRVDAADAELAALVGLRSGRVRVGAFSSALSELVPPAAAELRRDHPNLELELTDVHPRIAVQQLRAGELDLAIVFRYGEEPADDGIRYTYVRDDPIHLLSRRTGESLTDHRDSDWIAGCVNCRRELLQHCADAGFTPRIAFTTDDMIVKQAFVRAGLGVTTTPGLALRAHRTPGVRATELPIVRHIYLAVYGDPPDPPATRAFIDALKGVTLR